MKKFFLFCLLFASFEAIAQYSYPPFFQQVNRSFTNRFTTGGAISYRWQLYSDTSTADTMAITPSAFNNYYTVSHITRTDSITKNLVIQLNTANTYLGASVTFYINNNAGKTFSFITTSGTITSTTNSTTANYLCQFVWTGVKWQRTFNITN